jgi:hypothetical protein
MEAQIAMFLISLAVARGVHAYLENPAGSMMFSFLKLHIDHLMEAATLTVSYCNRCAYQDDDDSSPRYFKRYKWLSSHPWIFKAMRACACGSSFRHQSLMEVDSKGQTNGLPEHMQASAAYPANLGRALVAAWVDGQHAEATEVEQPSRAGSRFLKALSSHRAGKEGPGAQGLTARQLPTPCRAQGPMGPGAHQKRGHQQDVAAEEEDPWVQVPAAATSKGSIPAAAAVQSQEPQTQEEEELDPWDSKALSSMQARVPLVNKEACNSEGPCPQEEDPWAPQRKKLRSARAKMRAPVEEEDPWL